MAKLIGIEYVDGLQTPNAIMWPNVSSNKDASPSPVSSTFTLAEPVEVALQGIYLSSYAHEIDPRDIENQIIARIATDEIARIRRHSLLRVVGDDTI